MIIRRSRQLFDHYDELSDADTCVGILNLRQLTPNVLVDLLAQGVRCYPSALSQVLHRSKLAQALFLRRWMLPHTQVILRRVDLLDAMNRFHREGIDEVVTKQPHMHCGHGVRRWSSMELLYNSVALSEDAFPFVLQPFVRGATDVRVILVGDYVEAYTRYNPDNFRMNLAMGGRHRPHALSELEKRLCREVMARGAFPFAHVDLLTTPEGRTYLSEITLDGGVKGARIDRRELERLKRDVLDRLVDGHSGA
jgi:ribosomal protein S6--L-glutamate ligase